MKSAPSRPAQAASGASNSSSASVAGVSAAPAPGASAGAPAELRVLLVEDDAHDQVFVRRAFARCGVPVNLAVVNDGEEATAYLRGLDFYEDRALHPLPHLVVTDLKMPRMGGLDLLAWIRAQPHVASLPVVVLTSSCDQSDVANAYARGVSGYLIKPVKFGALADLVRVLVAYWLTCRLPSQPVPADATSSEIAINSEVTARAPAERG